MTINTEDRISIQKDPLLRLTSEPCTNEHSAASPSAFGKERKTALSDTERESKHRVVLAEYWK